jgi:glycosyltransferase involved in cell wall biosynthesis
MKVLFVIDLYEHPNGGTEGQLLELIQGISGTGESAQLAVLRASPFTREQGNLICPILTLNVGSMLSVMTLIRLLRFTRFLRHQRADIVHVFFNDSALIVPIFAKLAGCKVVVSRRDMGLWYSPGKLWLARLANRFVDRIIANSRAVADHVLRHEGGPQERVEVIYNGLSASRMAPPAQPGLRERLGIGNDDPIVGMVANLRPVKRPADAIQAFARVHQDHPSAHLILIGEGTLEGDLEALAG